MGGSKQFAAANLTSLAFVLLAVSAAESDAELAKSAVGAPKAQAATPDDDLYRRRGYGTGGLTFGLGRQGGTAQAGACADLAFVRPRNCGPQGGYGIYGNGLGYGFGF